MDPVAMASAVVTALSPYLAKAAGQVADSAGKAAWEAGARLFKSLKDKLAGKPEAAPAKQALDDLEAGPDDPDNQAALRKELKKLLAGNADLARELAELLPPQARLGSAVFSNQFHGNVGDVVQGHTITLNKH